MKYNIISINDDRKVYKDAIRKHTELEEVNIEAFNAHDSDVVLGIQERGLRLAPEWGNPKKGELGVWLSNYDGWYWAWENQEHLVMFEDDAIIAPDFDRQLNRLLGELPEDWAFCALWVPENQRQDYMYNIIYNAMDGSPQFLGYTTPDQSIFRLPESNVAALAYQGYGMVALVYSPNGGRRLVELAHSTGINQPVDCWIFDQAKRGFIKGYAPKPDRATLVDYDWAAESHVQQTERAL